MASGDAWTQDAVCPEVDPEVFFATGGGTLRMAKSICHNCPVSEQCLDFSLTEQIEYGVFGGYSAAERLSMMRNRYGMSYRWPQGEPLSSVKRPNDDKIKQLTEKGLSANQIAKVVGITRRSVVRARARTGASQVGEAA